MTKPKDSSVEEKQLQRTHAKEDWVTAGLSLFPRLVVCVARVAVRRCYLQRSSQTQVWGDSGTRRKPFESNYTFIMKRYGQQNPWKASSTQEWKQQKVLEHVDEFSRRVAGVGGRGVTGLYRCQDDLDYFRGSVSGLRSENYWMLTTMLPSKATAKTTGTKSMPEKKEWKD